MIRDARDNRALEKRETGVYKAGEKRIKQNIEIARCPALHITDMPGPGLIS